MKIVVDLMGGDLGPKVVYQGVQEFRKELEQQNKDKVKFTLVGDRSKLDENMSEIESDEDLEFVHTEKYVTMNDKPTLRNDETSIAIAAKLVKDNSGDALFSTGHTGAIMGQALMKFGRIKSVQRPCIAAKMPHAKGYFLLVDAGANVDCTVDQVVQFAQMGNIYANSVMGIEKPRVGLLNIGSEKKKGNKLTSQIYEELEKIDVNFIGNIEGQDIYAGEVDVVVCDGFDGNIFLKASEGIAKFILKSFQKTLLEEIKDKQILNNIMAKMIKTFDPSEYGGGVLIGLKKICIKGHGGSDIKSVKNTLNIAYTSYHNKINEKIMEIFKN